MCDWGTHQSVTLCFNVSVYATFYVSECHFCAGIPALHLRWRGSFCSDACASSTRSGQVPCGRLGMFAEGMKRRIHLR